MTYVNSCMRRVEKSDWLYGDINVEYENMRTGKIPKGGEAEYDLFTVSIWQALFTFDHTFSQCLEEPGVLIPLAPRKHWDSGKLYDKEDTWCSWDLVLSTCDSTVLVCFLRVCYFSPSSYHFFYKGGETQGGQVTFRGHKVNLWWSQIQKAFLGTHWPNAPGESAVLQGGLCGPPALRTEGPKTKCKEKSVLVKEVWASIQGGG